MSKSPETWKCVVNFLEAFARIYGRLLRRAYVKSVSGSEDLFYLSRCIVAILSFSFWLFWGKTIVKSVL